MLWMAGAAGAALDVLATLQKSLSAPGAAAGGAAAPFALGDDVDPTRATVKSSVANAIAPATLNALLSLQDPPGPADRVSSQIFSALDANGDGRLSKSEFTTPLTSGHAGQGLAQLLQKQAQLLAPPGRSVALAV